MRRPGSAESDNLTKRKQMAAHATDPYLSQPQGKLLILNTCIASSEQMESVALRKLTKLLEKCWKRC